ncbi:MAG: NUDIX domain-containing protein [Patescibacteria group bacterium]
MQEKNITCLTNTGENIIVPSSSLIFRPSVYGIIILEKNIVLLKNKSANKYWLPGGGVEITETIQEALKREVLEETGLILLKSKLATTTERFFYYNPTHEASHALLYFFYCDVVNKKLISDDRVDDEESGRPRWIPIIKLKPSDFADHGELIMNLIKKR